MKKILFAAVMAMGIMVAGCGDNSSNGSGSASGSLKISITNEAGSESRMAGNITQDQENQVFSFAAIVFNYQTGAKEKIQEFTQTLEGMVTDLSTATSKRVAVIVNYDPAILTAINNYNDLNTLLLSIESQDPATLGSKGLFMSGVSDDEIELSADEENKAEVTVRRVVAKVNLASLTVEPTSDYRLENFKLTGISMQKVPEKAYMFGENIPTLTTGDYRGGLTGTVSTAWTGLGDAYSLTNDYVAGGTLTPNLYYYIFPNNNAQGNPTMITLSATYNGNPLYYTFIINDAVITGQTDGTYIKRNMVYTLHITLKRLGLGGDDPDSIERFVTLEVDVHVSNWQGELIQYMEW